MKRTLLIIAGIAALSAGIWQITRSEPEAVSGPWVRIGKAVIPVELADTPELRTQGLSGRTSLAYNTGLLFVYTEPGPRAFWMKDMRFSIDIIWIGADMTVLGVTADVAPDTYPQTFSPPSPALHVLEVNAGFAAEHGIRAGDPVSLRLD